MSSPSEFQRSLNIPLDVNQSFFLFGPRGTGKTSWLKANVKNAIYFDLLKAKWRNLFLADPGRLEENIPENFDGWVIIDEVQKAPELLNEVHRLIEEKRYRFILTGSSARKLRQEGVNLLAGRAYIYNMHPLTAEEMGDAFQLDKYLLHGGIPAIYNTELSAEEFLANYIETYLEQEVLQEGLIRQLEPFARFLESASFSQGSTLNMTAVARDCAVSRKIVTGYFDILKDLLIGYKLQPFTRRAQRRLTMNPKFYYFDVGVFRYLRPQGPLDSTKELDGPALETLFLQNLRAINDYHHLGYSLYYWRTSTGTEVDFVLYGERGFYAFEIKRSAKITKSDLSGLGAFLKDYPEAKGYLLYGGTHREYHGNITVLPFIEVIQTLRDFIG
ncbi:MAG: ATPase [marine bacterium B5-7]|nr:MAG: ATPase [marine bacterium B5-7]